MQRPTAASLPACRTDRPAARLVAVAALLALADLLTKQIAVARLGAGADLSLGEALRLTLIHNHGLAWGLSGGGAAFAITLAGTAILLAAVAASHRPLAAVDASSPHMLGLIAGAAIGNAASLMLWPAGAPDFIALDRGDGVETVLNVADFGLFVGLALCCRTTWRIALALHADRVRHPALAPATTRTADAFAATPADAARRSAREWNDPRRPLEREIPLVVARERGARAPAPRHSELPPRPVRPDVPFRTDDRTDDRPATT